MIGGRKWKTSEKECKIIDYRLKYIKRVNIGRIGDKARGI